MKPYRIIRSKFNPNKPRLKQIFCCHEYHGEKESVGWWDCYFMICHKCGKYKDMYYYYNKRW